MGVDINDGTRSYTENTRREKLQLKDLNTRLGQYIARVRLLEDQNSGLVQGLNKLSISFGQKNRENRADLSHKISATRKSYNNANRIRFQIDTRAGRIRDKINDYRARIEEIGRLREGDRLGLRDYERAVKEQQDVLAHAIERYNQALHEESAVLNENNRLRGAIDSVYEQIDVIVVDRLDFQSQLARIELEINLIKKIHETEVSELSKMIVLAPADTKEFFKSEIILAIKDIRKEFDSIHVLTLSRTRAWYEQKIHVPHVQNSHSHKMEVIETCRIKCDQLTAKRREIEALNSKLESERLALSRQKDEEMRAFESALDKKDKEHLFMSNEYNKLRAEYQEILAINYSMDSEISIYKALVEGEEKRVGVKHDYVHVQQTVHHHQPITQEKDINGSGANEIKFNSHASGNIVLKCDTVGRFLTLENTSSFSNENISGWRISRQIDNLPEISYNIPYGTSIAPKGRVKIYPGGTMRGPSDLVNHDITSWGMGTHAMTTLYNQSGVARANFEQRASVEDI